MGDRTSVTDLLESADSNTADSAIALESDDDQRHCFHHIHLPKLDDTAIIDYDARNETVRYNSHPRLEKVLARAAEMEATD